VANQLLTITMITNEGLMVLENNTIFCKQVNREYSGKFGDEGAKIGTVLNVRKPPRYIGRTGQGLSLEDMVETSVPVALTTQFGVDIAFTTQDLKLSIDDFRERFLDPAYAAVANKIDFDGLQLFLQVFNEVGVPGTVPNALITYLNAGVALDNQATPRDAERAIVISPQMQATIVDALKGLFQESDDIAEQYKKGTMGRTAGFKFSMDQNVPTFTTGTQGGTPVLTATVGQIGSSIATTGWTASTLVLNQGDIVQFAGCFSVNPQNRQSTGVLANWVVTASVTSGSGAGAASIPIAGPGGLGIVTSGPFQNASASPTASGAVTVNGATAVSSYRGLAFHKNAFTFASADLPQVGGVDMCGRAALPKIGLSTRMIRAYDINTDRLPTRTDVLYGWAVLYPELACRIAS
jgi:coat protein Gp5